MSTNVVSLSRKPCSCSVFVGILLITHSAISSAHHITWINQPTDPTFGVSGENITLEWVFRLSDERDKLFQFFLKRWESTDWKEIATYVNSTNKGQIFDNRFAFVKHGNPSFVLMNAKESDETKYCCRILTEKGQPDQNCVELKILVRPNITSMSRNQAVAENDDLTLSCNASGKPPPNVTWLKQGNIEWRHLGSILRLRNISRDQHGETYFCIAKNNVSNATATVTIAVNYAPAISLPANSYMNVTEGADAVLHCPSDGRPPPTTTWSKVNALSQRSYPPGERLNITNANRSDDGEYICTATNGVGKEETATFHINIFYPPTIVGRTVIQTLNETGELRLECYARGNPPPSITWTKVPDPTPLDSPDGILTVHNANKTHSGVYQCRANNGIGKDAFALSTAVVNYKPVRVNLRSDAKDDRVIAGKSLTFSCIADGVPPPDLEMRLNNVSLGFFENSTFTVQNVNISHNGTYECAPRNFLGSGPIGTLNMTVQVPPSIDFVSHEITVNETDNVTLFCNASGIPKPVVTWTFKDMKTTVTMETLSLPLVSRSQTGRYRCTAANGVAKPESAHVDINVNYKPEIEDGTSKEVTSWIDHETKFTCVAHGSPLPEVKWSLDGSVEENVYLSTRISILRFKPKQASDFDVVVCTAKNFLGFAEARVAVKQLHVPDAPKILRVDQGDNNLKIYWEESNAEPGFPILSYTVQVREKGESQEWMNCTQITHQTDSMMCIMYKLRSATGYIVRVSAKNIVGYSDFTIREVSTKERTETEKQQDLPGSTVHWIIAGVIVGVCVLLVVVVAISMMRRRSRGRREVKNLNKSCSKKVIITSYDNPSMEEGLQTCSAVLKEEQNEHQ